MKNKSFFFKTLFSKLLLIWFIAGNAQAPIVPPPPEAASFFKSTEIPVSMYTGLPNIGVDFYTIKTKELQIPIRISYNARGIQVAEMASRTGLGWALQYGGMISRQTRGFADENSGILYHNYYPGIFSNSSYRESLTNDELNDEVDEIPDQFFYDVNGESGKFIFDYNDRQPVFQKFTDLKITPIRDNVLGFIAWIVTDKMGNKYYYGRSKDSSRTAYDYDNTSQSYSFSDIYGMTQLPSGTQRFSINAWHLMEIETYMHESIKFYYNLEEGSQYQRSYDKVLTATPDNPNSVKQEVSYFSSIVSSQYQVSEIDFPGGKVVFESDSTQRKDFTGTHTLHKISVLDDQNNSVKSFEFKYNYQRCVDDNNQLNYLYVSDTSAKYRLFLSQIHEKPNSGDSLPPYQFEYDSTKLPNRFSNSQDNWGYYNGKPNGQYLTFFNYNTAINRTVDTSLSGAGLLKKITYPTGGTSNFIYEQNRVMPPEYITSLLYNQNNPSDTVNLGDGFFRDTAYWGNGMYSKVFNIGATKTGPVIFNFFTGMDTTVHYNVVLERLDASGTTNLYPYDTYRELSISSGQYRLEVIPVTPSDSTAPFLAGLDWKEINYNPSGLDSGEWYGAGKRIKRIEHKIGNDLIGFKKYEYKKDNGKTSGKMLGLPNFYYVTRQYLGGFAFIDGHGCMPGSPLTGLQGNSIGYQRVTEYYGDSANNQGKSVYEFTVDDDAGDYFQFPYHIPTDFEWLRGLPLTTKIYKNNAGTYELKKSIENVYRYADTNNTANIFSQPFQHMDSSYTYRKDRNLFYLALFTFAPSYDIETQFIDINSTSFKVYYLTAGTVDLDSTVEKDYENSVVLTKTVRYGYKYPNHYLSVSQRTKTSKGDSSIAVTYFPPDISSRTSAEQKLVDQNRIAVPVKVEDSVKNNSNTLLASTVKKTQYKDWGNNLVLSELQQTSINNSSFFTDLTFNKYDTSGSPVELTPRAGIKQTYLWDYKGQYPIAQCVNADSASVAYTSFEADGTGNWSGINSSYLQAGDAITGNKYYKQTSFNLSKSGLNSSNYYTISYWSAGSSYSISGTQSGYPKILSSITVGDTTWTQYEHLVTGQSTIAITGSGAVDELRLYPRGAMMTTYTYKPLVGMTGQCDPSGHLTYYSYDNFGRLQLIRDQNQKILKKYDYKYASQ